MLLRDFLPLPSVREFVQWFRIVHFEFEKTANIPYKAYSPKPEQTLHFFLRDPFAIEKAGYEKTWQPSILLCGQQTSLIKQSTGSSIIDVQIVFQPTAVFQLTGIPAFELTNQHLDATSIFPKDIQLTLEQLQEAKDYSELLKIAERFAQRLVDHAQKDSILLDDLSRQMTQSSGNLLIDWLAKESCLCTKQFKRKFNERTGINPKTFLRIIRFNRTVNLKNRFPNKDWLRIALECDYHDYQHLVKDYKDFTGLTPKEFYIAEKNAPESTLGLTNDVYVSRCPLIF